MTSYADALRSRIFTGADIASLIEGIFTSTFPLTWSSWTPTFTASGSMTITSTAITSAKYCQIGKLVFFKLAFTGTIGGTPSFGVRATLPVTAATVGVEYFSSLVVDGDASIPASPVSRIYDTTSKLEVLKSRAAASYTAGGSFQAYTSGFYEAS